eukprot:5807840-Pyramimonas_sp.AAC.1
MPCGRAKLATLRQTTNIFTGILGLNMSWAIRTPRASPVHRALHKTHRRAGHQKACSDKLNASFAD